MLDTVITDRIYKYVPARLRRGDRVVWFRAPQPKWKARDLAELMDVLGLSGGYVWSVGSWDPHSRVGRVVAAHWGGFHDLPVLRLGVLHRSEVSGKDGLVYFSDISRFGVEAAEELASILPARPYRSIVFARDTRSSPFYRWFRPLEKQAMEWSTQGWYEPHERGCGWAPLAAQRIGLSRRDGAIPVVRVEADAWEHLAVVAPAAKARRVAVKYHVPEVGGDPTRFWGSRWDDWVQIFA